MLNLSAVVETNSRMYPDRTAIIAGDVRLSHRELNEASSQVASGLQAAGICKGDRVAMSCGTNAHFPICYYGVLKAGGVVVALNTLLKKRDIADQLKSCDATAYICDEGTEQLPISREGWGAFQEADACRHFWMIPNGAGGQLPGHGARWWSELVESRSASFDTVQTDGEDPCGIVFTSGTTGYAKGAELSHSNYVLNCQTVRDVLGYCPDDVVIVAAPLYNVLGQTLLMGAGLTGGATLMLLPRFESGAVLQAMQDHGGTVMGGVPTMFRALLHHPQLESFDLDTIRRTWRVGLCGGAPVPPELLSEVERVFHAQMIVGYGLSETTAGACFTRRGMKRKPGSIGVPLWGVEMRIVNDDMHEVKTGDPGEVVIRGHNVMKGYYRNDVANVEAFRGGWLHTGDIGKADEDGHFYILDRKKDMIIRGGRKVFPNEVERVILTHPDVAMTAVIGIPDEVLGEEIRAYVVPRAGANVCSESLISWCKEQMAAHVYPRSVVLTDALPLGPTGKILKEQIRVLDASRH